MSKKSTDQPEQSVPFAIVDDDGKEIPITDDMIEAAIVDAKPQSIGKHTLPEVPVISDEMLRKAGKLPDEDQ